jgi:hypothetical protein
MPNPLHPYYGEAGVVYDGGFFYSDGLPDVPPNPNPNNRTRMALARRGRRDPMVLLDRKAQRARRGASGAMVRRGQQDRRGDRGRTVRPDLRAR